MSSRAATSNSPGLTGASSAVGFRWPSWGRKSLGSMRCPPRAWRGRRGQRQDRSVRVRQCVARLTRCGKACRSRAGCGCGSQRPPKGAPGARGARSLRAKWAPHAGFRFRVERPAVGVGQREHRVLEPDTLLHAATPVSVAVAVRHTGSHRNAGKRPQVSGVGALEARVDDGNELYIGILWHGGPLLRPRAGATFVKGKSPRRTAHGTRESLAFSRRGPGAAPPNCARRLTHQFVGRKQPPRGQPHATSRGPSRVWLMPKLERGERYSVLGASLPLRTAPRMGTKRTA